jgi:fructosamine-3-kinase
VGGGCINHGARLALDGGSSFFVKWNHNAPVGVFDAEAEGLRALRRPGFLRVPEPLAWSDGESAPGWLLLEYVARGRPTTGYDERLAQGLASLHRSADAASQFGWSADNWIGPLTQSNQPSSSWSAFWRDRRLVPQVRLARSRGYFEDHTGRALNRMIEAVPVALADVDAPHLLHGDLWSGNAYPGTDGEPVLIDPATYRGHCEVDLAMTELFGGFGPRFYAAYDEAAGISAAYHAYRRDLYQLYYLLVHVNLFGAQYLRRTVVAAERVSAALS